MPVTSSSSYVKRWPARDAVLAGARVWAAAEARRRPELEALGCFGSYARGDAGFGSDLDLVLRGPGLAEIPSGQIADFEEAVRESTIPFLVEARDWARLPERFHREIERDYAVMVGRNGGNR